MASPTERPVNLLELNNISAGYDQLWALKNIYLTLRAAEIHAIVGEHGAGKSSLGMILSGLLKPQIGRLTFDGKDYRAFTLKIALKLGIRMVQQHTLSLNPYFSLADNFALDSRPLYHPWRKKHTLAAAKAFLTRHQIPFDPAMRVKDFTIADQTFVDILKNMYAQPRLLILDEALEKLSAANFKTIVTMLQRFKAAGMAILLVTHRIDDIYQLADRVSVIKHGEILVTDEVKNIDKINLIKMAYTQIAAAPNGEDLNREFYHLLKYNEAILRSLPVNLIVTDNENRIKLVNDHCKRSFGLIEESSYLNVPLRRLFSSTHEPLAQVLASRLAGHAERVFYQAPIMVNDVTITSNLKTFPIYDGPAFIGNIIIIEDMTEYDRLQKQVILSEKLASVGLLAAGVAHEINNPLEIMATHLEYLKYKFHASEVHKAADLLQEQITDINNIVSNLLTFSDNRPLVNEEIELNGEIRNMLNLIKHNAKYNAIAIRFDPEPRDVFIRASKREIKQVLLNLLKNSFEAMPGGGEIFIQTALIAENGVHLVQMTFQDTGPGIGDENPDNIFLPFYSTKKGQEENLGLGLSVSYGIIKKYNGSIAVKNLENAGCQFTMKLPQAR